MATRYGRGYRRTRGYKRRYTRRRSYATRTRRYRRRYSRRRTTSAVVKLTQDTNWTLNTISNGQTRWNAFSFSPLSLPGFAEYQTTYSHFRILKAKLFVSRGTTGGGAGSTNNYLVVGSRPFASTTGPFENYTNLAESYVPPQLETALRQTKWQRIHYPSTISNRVTAGFHPYTLVGTFGPAGIGNAVSYQRIWEAKRWMPFNWAHTTLDVSVTTEQGIMFFGPYMVVDSSLGEIADRMNVQCTLQVHVQFKGQR